MPGPHFKIHSPGDQFAFSHPVSETKYTLTVQKIGTADTFSKPHGTLTVGCIPHILPL